MIRFSRFKAFFGYASQDVVEYLIRVFRTFIPPPGDMPVRAHKHKRSAVERCGILIRDRMRLKRQAAPARRLTHGN